MKIKDLIDKQQLSKYVQQHTAAMQHKALLQLRLKLTEPHYSGDEVRRIIRLEIRKYTRTYNRKSLNHD